MDEAIRLNRFLAERLGISRREADEYIASGRVSIDGEKAMIGARVHKGNTVSCDGKKLSSRVKHTYLLLNKPAGCVCSRRRQGNSPTVYELLPEKYRALKTVGRLDKDSSGLLILTNDGEYAHRMTHPSFSKVKIYDVELDRELEPLHQQMIADFGVELEDGKSQMMLECQVGDRRKWRVTMHEGRNRQIRRTFRAVGYEVVRLHRIVFGPYRLNNLSEGEWVEIEVNP